jgi:hypothetical protein
VIDRGKDKKRWSAGSQAEVAAFFGVSVQAVSVWRQSGMPGTPGHYDLAEVLNWLRTKGPWRPKAEIVSGPAKDMRLEYQAQREGVKLRKELGELIPREHVHATYQELAESLRGAGDVLQRVYGEAALEILNDALDRARDAINGRFAADSSVDHSGDA